MKKTICKKEYDTETATCVKKVTEGFFGDPAGYEKTLYRTADGFYFLYTNGGADSAYKSPEIKRVSAAVAEKFIEG